MLCFFRPRWTPAHLGLRSYSSPSSIVQAATKTFHSSGTALSGPPKPAALSVPVRGTGDKTNGAASRFALDKSNKNEPALYEKTQLTISHSSLRYGMWLSGHQPLLFLEPVQDLIDGRPPHICHQLIQTSKAPAPLSSNSTMSNTVDSLYHNLDSDCPPEVARELASMLPFHPPGSHPPAHAQARSWSREAFSSLAQQVSFSTRAVQADRSWSAVEQAIDRWTGRTPAVRSSTRFMMGVERLGWRRRSIRTLSILRRQKQRRKNDKCVLMSLERLDSSLIPFRNRRRRRAKV